MANTKTQTGLGSEPRQQAPRLRIGRVLGPLLLFSGIWLLLEFGNFMPVKATLQYRLPPSPQARHLHITLLDKDRAWIAQSFFQLPPQTNTVSQRLPLSRGPCTIEARITTQGIDQNAKTTVQIERDGTYDIYLEPTPSPH